MTSARDALRVPERVAEAGPAAHRLRHEPHVGETQVIDEPGEVVDVGVRAAPARRLPREAEPPVVEGHARVAVPKVRHLLPPAQVAAAQPVGEDQRGTRAVGLVVEPGAVALEKGHGEPPGQAAAPARSARPTCST